MSICAGLRARLGASLTLGPLFCRLVDALKLAGWCWSGYNLAIDNARQVLVVSTQAQSEYLRSRSSVPSGGVGGARYTPTPTSFPHNVQYSPSSSTYYSPNGGTSSYPPAAAPPPPAEQWATRPPSATSAPGAASNTPNYPYPSPDFTDSHLLHNPAFSGSYPPQGQTAPAPIYEQPQQSRGHGFAPSYPGEVEYGRGGSIEEDSKDRLGFLLSEESGQVNRAQGEWRGPGV